ncbi:UDP-glucose 4-epimerase GalE [Corynebacterium aquatimens]|uniref:UDP-glucose 4-epimerase n=1 Tax=Corynebacterium aquatimens TaxID=1190508 RepID=A0A931E0F6_9CORY|nr:UDP-glucose 4-epimerase GalE [Corynebacterium aquatimens]MBG6122434.1 UDP-glucose 4-epimerase [Corynebacterium aquatimens]WJY65026.1 UDP-glucose 4-epimerase [Corynebacterium aquatimens]
MKVLITGGAGYIGSTIAACCQEAGITPVILDDYSRGLRVFAAPYAHYEGDVASADVLARVFSDHPDIDAVVHCAASIIVPESVQRPLDYYANNVGKTIALLAHLQSFGVRRVILSSTAAVYAPAPDYVASEDSPVAPQSPYAASKLIVERILADTAATGALSAISLRYFNPIGADPLMRSGLQDPAPTHALGQMIAAHRAGRPFTVTGTAWPTRDGSGLRDYVHVWDLARAHVAALTRFADVIADTPGHAVINLGTGTGTTVFELVDAFAQATGVPLPIKTAPPRSGDVVGAAASADKAHRLLDWSPQLTLADGVAHSLEWESRLTDVLAREALAREGTAGPA